jgi:hypothetical protein
VGGVMKFHQIFHKKDGNPTWVKSQVKGEAFSLFTGETFKYREINKLDITEMVRTVKFVLQGDNGTKYIGTATLDFKTWELTYIHLLCK